MAPRASAPARVRGLRVKGATARWAKSAGAVSYEVQVRRGDGQTTVRHTKQRTFRIPRAGRVRVAVRPVGASGMVGVRATARAAVRAGRSSRVVPAAHGSARAAIERRVALPQVV